MPKPTFNFIDTHSLDKANFTVKKNHLISKVRKNALIDVSGVTSTSSKFEDSYYPYSPNRKHFRLEHASASPARLLK